MNMSINMDTTKLIPVQLVDAEVRTCPYVGWYQFKKCTIKTCKNYSSKTRSRCLALDRSSPTGSKVISDAELNLFKYSNENVSTRHISTRRKNAIDRVKCILALHGFIEHLKTKFGSEPERNGVFTDPMLAELESTYPLKLRRLEFQNWMWPLVVSKREYKLFANRGRGECKEFGVHDLLSISRQDLESVRRTISLIKNDQLETEQL